MTRTQSLFQQGITIAHHTGTIAFHGERWEGAILMLTYFYLDQWVSATMLEANKFKQVFLFTMIYTP
jgi:hypothetical protein